MVALLPVCHWLKFPKTDSPISVSQIIHTFPTVLPQNPWNENNRHHLDLLNSSDSRNTARARPKGENSNLNSATAGYGPSQLHNSVQGWENLPSPSHLLRPKASVQMLHSTPGSRPFTACPRKHLILLLDIITTIDSSKGQGLPPGENFQEKSLIQGMQKEH